MMRIIEKAILFYLDIVLGKTQSPFKLFLIFLLSPFSLLYRIITRLAFYLQTIIFRPYEPECPVISVGNITWGGSGKTPFSIFLAEHLKIKAIHLAFYCADTARMKPHFWRRS